MKQEQILCISREALAAAGYLPATKNKEGVITGEQVRRFLHWLETHAVYHERCPALERNKAWKQIIPYIVCFAASSPPRVLITRRSARISEQRLANLVKVGIGGHVRREDMESGGLQVAARRELSEEIKHGGLLTLSPVALLNAEKNEVDWVHYGVVYYAVLREPISLHPESGEDAWHKLVPLGKLHQECVHAEYWTTLLLKKLLPRQAPR